MGDFVKVEKSGSIATITIARPDRMNAIDREVLASLQAIIEQLREDHDVRAAILTGEGKAFVAGADIDAMKTMTPSQAREFSALGHRVLAGLEALPFPVIAAVNGFALGGGCELALACDFIHVSTKAKLGQPEVKLGVVPGFGGTQRLARRVGIGRARQLVYTGEIIGAEEAVRIGLAVAMHEPEALMPAVRSIAEVIATMGPLAVAAAKRVMLEGEDIPLAQANAREIDAFSRCFETKDQREGMAAFGEKRAPQFTGR